MTTVLAVRAGPDGLRFIVCFLVAIGLPIDGFLLRGIGRILPVVPVLAVVTRRLAAGEVGGVATFGAALRDVVRQPSLLGALAGILELAGGESGDDAAFDRLGQQQRPLETGLLDGTRLADLHGVLIGEGALTAMEFVGWEHDVAEPVAGGPVHERRVEGVSQRHPVRLAPVRVARKRLVTPGEYHDSMTTNGDRPEPMNSRTITVWLPEADREYLNEYAAELGLENRDGGPNRNGALRKIIDEHRKLRTRRLAKK